MSRGAGSAAGSILSLAGWILLCLLAGALGAVVSGPGPWYQELAKPAWTPPPWVFGPVWTLLYVLMGLAAWLVWQRRGDIAAGRPLGWFVAQLAVNAAWSWIFFGMRRPGLALLDLIVLLTLLAITMREFSRVRPAAAALLLPYLAWSGFALCLNAAIWWLNGGAG